MSAGNSGAISSIHLAVAKRPAVPAAVLFVAGILLHDRLPPWPGVWIAVLALIVAISFVWTRISLASLAAGFLLAGVLGAQLFDCFYPRDHISAFATDIPRLAEIELRIDHPPRMLSNRFETGYPLPPKQVATGMAVRIKTLHGWEDASGEMLLAVTAPHPQLSAGQTVRAIGMLQRPAPANNPGQFDWASYYREQRILASFQIPGPANIQILDSPPPGLLLKLRQRSRELLAAGFDEDHSVDHALLRALVLGDHDPELRDVQAQFRKTGTSHHLAISGMHIALIGGLVWWICRILRMSPRVSAIVMLAVIAVYGAAVLPSPPVVRALLICFSFAIGLTRARPVDALQMLAISAIAMLAFAPIDLYNPGFQLSFLTVAGLILFTRPILNFLNRDKDVDEQVTWQFRPRTFFHEGVRNADRAVLNTIAAGMAAWIVSLPIVAFHFEQLNPWAVLAGIALALFVSLALIAGVLKIVLTLFIPTGAEWWASGAEWTVWLMRKVLDLLTKLPWGDVPVPPPPVWLIAIFFLLLLTSLIPNQRSGTRWTLRIAKAIVFLSLLFLPFTRAYAAQSAFTGEVRVTLLSVGAGQCAVIEPPSGRTTVIDAGSISRVDLLSKCLSPFLRSRGCTSVDAVYISHADYDHYSSVGEVVSAYGVREIMTATQFASHASLNSQGRKLLADLNEMEHPPRLIVPGERMPLGRDTAIEVLWPPKDFVDDVSNDNSLVLRLTHAGKSILFAGDIQDTAMKELLKDPAKLKADVLIAPHHGSREEMTATFIRAVDPKFILSSNDRTLTSKQRRFDELKVVKERTFYRTHRRGAIEVIISREGEMRLETFLDEAGQPVN